MLDDLRKKCDEVLIENLPARVKKVLDEGLMAGMSAKELLKHCENAGISDSINNPSWTQRHRLIMLAATAYLESKGHKTDEK